jgi:hypothetical protein
LDWLVIAAPQYQLERPIIARRFECAAATKAGNFRPKYGALSVLSWMNL